MTTGFIQATEEIQTQEGFINVPSGKLWYQKLFTKENESKTPLIALAGGPGCKHDYLKALVAQTNKLPVIFYDQRDIGKSRVDEQKKELWTIEQFVLDLAQLITALNLDKVHLLGHSWGAVPVFEYSLRYPEKVASIIFASPLLSTPRWISDAKMLLAQLPKDVQETILQHEAAGTTNDPAYQLATRVFYKQFVCRNVPMPSAFDNADMYVAMWGPSEFTATGTLKNYDRAASLSMLQCPVLFTCGRFDEARPETIVAFAQSTRNSKVVVFEESAHLAMCEEPEAYQNAVGQFLDEVMKK